MTLIEMGALARKAASAMGQMSENQKNNALLHMADALEARADEWLSANAVDVEAARDNGMSAALLDRLSLTAQRIHAVADGLRQVTSLPDPIGEILEETIRPNGLKIRKVRVPLGVIGIIYEARPNVTADAAGLCLKSGNACILRGGKEAIHSNLAAAAILRRAAEEAGLPADAIQLVSDTSRESARELMHLNRYIDVLIPRGGAGLIRSVINEATVPVIHTGEGVCHVYIDRDADIAMGAKILQNAKCSRPSVCNAAECLLLHRDIANAFLKAAVPLLDESGVELRCDPEVLSLLPPGRGLPAAEGDWDAEYNDLILAVKTVDSTEEAIAFIDRHGTRHSEAIVTENARTAELFLNTVDAAAVYWNASTRFTDGGEFGLGAEIGISTQKLHARGPMGLKEMTTYKYLIVGQGQTR